MTSPPSPWWPVLRPAVVTLALVTTCCPVACSGGGRLSCIRGPADLLLDLVPDATGMLVRGIAVLLRCSRPDVRRPRREALVPRPGLPLR